jgi:TPR repeat protein
MFRTFALIAALLLAFAAAAPADTFAALDPKQAPKAAAKPTTDAAAPEAAAPADPQAQPRPQTISADDLFAIQLASAEKGNKQACLNVGMFYEQGVGIHKDYTKALYWYERAAQAGIAEGYLNAGNCYIVGMGTASDVPKAAQYFAKAAEKGSAQAQYQLAVLYLSGRGVDQDTAQGLKLLEKAANAGNAFAANDLGIIYMNGSFDQPKDPKKAVTWYEKGADTGYLMSITSLAGILKDGTAGKADPVAALKWYMIAQKGGMKSAELDQAIQETSAKLDADKVKAADAEATKWMEDHAKRNQQPQPAPQAPAAKPAAPAPAKK